MTKFSTIALGLNTFRFCNSSFHNSKKLPRVDQIEANQNTIASAQFNRITFIQGYRYVNRGCNNV
jgi:hypothetical protein